MKILVYPHDLNMGGSQMNALELAASVRDAGHECLVFGRPGVLLSRIEELGLEFIESPPPSLRPSPNVVRALRGVVRERRIDVVHGYEWPPGLEAYLATAASSGTRAVCTVMSMAVAPFLPHELPLIVGTPQIAAHEKERGRASVHVLEPPVDLVHNARPDDSVLAEFASRWELGGRPLVVCVSRLASELKAEGILTAIEVAAELADDLPFQFLVVGDGPARAQIDAAATRVNRATGTNTVVLTGELLDPRPAYALADVALGMGGSALRAMAFGKPLVVQGEHGFFATLTPDTVDTFTWQGWYGVGPGGVSGNQQLTTSLKPLLGDEELRASLGAFASSVVDRFSLARLTERQLQIYAELADPAAPGRAKVSSDAIAWRSRLARYHLGQQLGRVTKRNRMDDFNARPVAARQRVDRTRRPRGSASGPIIYVPGVEWGAVPGTDRRLAEALAKHRDVIWVDPARSLLETRRTGIRVEPVSHPVEGITRLSVDVPPGNTRPGMRSLARRMLAIRVGQYLAEADLKPSAIVASTTEPLLAGLAGIGGTKVYFATDDFVAGAGIWRRSAEDLRRSREQNLAVADLVLAVTPDLARDLRRRREAPVWFPNGVELSRYAGIESVQAAANIRLEPPFAGVVGQMNERLDLAYLKALAEAGERLLLVGPRTFRDPASAERFDALTARPSVQWFDWVAPDLLPGYLKAMSAGLTPYAESTFNRRSYPLKTVEYLAAGLPVVTSDVPPRDGLDPRYVVPVHTPSEFVAAVRHALEEDVPRARVQASVAGCGWEARAAHLLELLDERSV